MPQLLPAGDTPTRLATARQWLVRTWTGRLLLAGVACKLVARIARLAAWQSGLFGAIDTIGGLALFVVALVVGYRLYIAARHRLLWRVRRKLVISYVFIGVVPVLLVVLFFTLAGLLFFFNVSAYMLRTRMGSLVEAAQFLAQAAAPAVGRAATPERLVSELAPRQAAAASRYPRVSYAVVPGGGRCATVAGPAAAPATVGPWMHAEAPRVIPDWVPCDGYASLILVGSEEQPQVVARAVAWASGADAALVVDIPFGEELAKILHDEMGLTLQAFSTAEAFDEEEAAKGAKAGERRLILGPMNVRISEAQQEPLGWVAFLDHRSWTTGQDDTVAVAFRMGPATVYRYLSGPSFERLNNFNFGQILLFVLAVVGCLFLVVQAVAFVMGFTLARSITGSVHELFAGTERVRRGDFAHKIAIRSRDQLGELAGSFNSMTASIEGLLREKAEKERLEQELRIARSIQMSLLPQGELRVPGIALSGHCEPAREVGGDYYDFLPIDDNRLGILIADVAGKGTSAALYMAELKGLVLSLSQQHASPRRLLIDADRLIAKHLSPGSFITMTYAVLDRTARTLTCARAGHCPLVYVPSQPADARRAQLLTPDGMVLGLPFDTGGAFERLLEEVTLPIGPGDLVLLYTDGMSEAMNAASECFGDNRLAEVAARHADRSADDIQRRILDEVHGFTGDAPQHDDMTMVLIKVEDL